MNAGITALTKSGLKDWFVQRISALVILTYLVWIVWMLLSGRYSDFSSWQAIFMTMPMKIFTLLAVVSMLAHAWVGIWTILTDYVKCAWLMGILQTLFILSYIGCFFWTIAILWP